MNIAITLEPKRAETHSSLGAALLAQGRSDEAISVLRKALRLKPDFDEAHFNLGLALQARGKLSEAAAEYREALRFNPDLRRLIPGGGLGR